MTNSKYQVCKDNNGDVVSIVYGEQKCDYLNGFINIWLNDPQADGILSPFKTTEDAELFAKAIVKLLKSVESVVDDV